ncbi:MAG: tyrosine protein phosphatase [bacterium]|nr:tyrosine protein phosphatase [bacterium]
MIDIHTHIMPGVDDGAPDMETAVKMLQIAEEDGVKTIVATPHTFSNVSLYKNPEPLREKFNQLKAAAKQENINVKILPGAENFFHSRLKEYLREWPQLLTINNSDYFLLEFPVDFIFPGTRQFIFDVMNDGFIPIICHPERNRAFRNNPELLYQFLRIGALSQVTAGSIRGDFGTDSRDAALDFLKFNLVNIIASDSHHHQFRPPRLSFVYEVLKEMDRGQIDILVQTAPRAVIDNEALPDTGPMTDPTRNSSVFDFFKSMFQ